MNQIWISVPLEIKVITINININVIMWWCWAKISNDVFQYNNVCKKEIKILFVIVPLNMQFWKQPLWKQLWKTNVFLQKQNMFH